MTGDRLQTAVVGAGYVGIATAVGLAEQGRDIVLIEHDPGNVAAGCFSPAADALVKGPDVRDSTPA